MKKKIFKVAQKNIDHSHEIHEEIGRGSSSVFKRGVHKSTGESVAIKIIDKKHLSGDDIQNQVAAMNLLKDAPKIVRLLDIYESDTTVWLVFDFVPGGNLFDKVTQKGALEEDEAKLVINSITEAIAYCHKNCVLHRDLQVENILCGKNFAKSPREVFLTSFGKAVVLEAGKTVSDWTGSVSYKAPEHIERAPYSFPSDCWALGVMTYIILGGYKPFDTIDPTDPPLRTQILSARVIFHEQEWKQVSENAKDFILKLLQPDPNQRLTAEQALNHPFLEVHSVDNRSSPRRTRKSSIRQINFVPLTRKMSVTTLQTDTITKSYNPYSQDNILDFPLSPKGPSETSKDIKTLEGSGTRADMKSSEGSGSRISGHGITRYKRNSIRGDVTNTKTNELFSNGIEELLFSCGVIKGGLEDISDQIQTLLKDLNNITEDGNRWAKENQITLN